VRSRTRVYPGPVPLLAPPTASGSTTSRADAAHLVRRPAGRRLDLRPPHMGEPPQLRAAESHPAQRLVGSGLPCVRVTGRHPDPVVADPFTRRRDARCPASCHGLPPPPAPWKDAESCSKKSTSTCTTTSSCLLAAPHVHSRRFPPGGSQRLGANGLSRGSRGAPVTGTGGAACSSSWTRSAGSARG